MRIVHHSVPIWFPETYVAILYQTPAWYHTGVWYNTVTYVPGKHMCNHFYEKWSNRKSSHNKNKTCPWHMHRVHPIEYGHRFVVLRLHYSDVIMGAMASQITSLTIVYSTVCSGADQRKHQSSASLAFVRGIHRWPVNSPHKWPVTRKIFSFDDVIMMWSGLGEFIWSFSFVIILSIRMGTRDAIAHILKGCINSTVSTIWLPKNQWSELERYGVKSVNTKPQQNATQGQSCA